MSAQFGIWNIDGQAIDPALITSMSTAIAPYGPDGENSQHLNALAMLYRPFHTTEESRREEQPCVTPLGNVFTWDGRLDNREELLRQLNGHRRLRESDADLVGAAYDQWGPNCFAKLVGDWAAAIFETRTRTLYLAKDFIGTRSLYYSHSPRQVLWSTTLEPLLLSGDCAFEINEAFVAGYLCFLPSPQLSPFVGIDSVPPASCVRIRHHKRTVHCYWSFDPGKALRYHSDKDYEEHFRQVLTEAVRRRLRSDRPVLAELSGGLDSSSIVCLADSLLAGAKAGAPRLDTVSYYSDNEPNWNERPYFSIVEEKRGRRGCHIDSSQDVYFSFNADVCSFAPMPGFGSARPGISDQFASLLRTQGNRVLLSGTGGDEMLGGVPAPVPGLADLLMQGHLRRFWQQLFAWSETRREPWTRLFSKTIDEFLPSSLRRRTAACSVPWLDERFGKQQAANVFANWQRFHWTGPLPSFQDNLRSVDYLRRQLNCTPRPPFPLHEIGYPYMDRDLLEFLFAIPREQLIQPRQRRLLMRRALAGIVPDEILNRTRKAYVSRGPLAAVAAEWSTLSSIVRDLESSAAGFVDQKKFVRALNIAKQGTQIPIVPLLRTFALEMWLCNLKQFQLPPLARGPGCITRDAQSLRAAGNKLSSAENKTNIERRWKI